MTIIIFTRMLGVNRFPVLTSLEVVILLSVFETSSTLVYRASPPLTTVCRLRKMSHLSVLSEVVGLVTLTKFNRPIFVTKCLSSHPSGSDHLLPNSQESVASLDLGGTSGGWKRYHPRRQQRHSVARDINSKVTNGPSSVFKFIQGF